MNALKIIRWTINPQKYLFIPGKSWLDVSTKVTPVKQSNLMEFFDTTENLYESKIIHGKLNFYDLVWK